MNAKSLLGRAKKIDFQRLADDFKGLDPNDPGVWPLAPRVVVLLVVFLLTLAAVWWFDWQDQMNDLSQRQAQEQKLRNDWVAKKRLAVNLDAYRQQLAEIDREFGALLRQLPNKAEMDSLLSDINQAGLGRGLQFELFKPGTDVVKEFYAEMPITIKVSGSYHDFGAFVSDIAKLPRIVTLNNVVISGKSAGKAAGKGDSDGRLTMDATAVTYRYLDEDEIAQQRKAKLQQRKKR